MRESLIKIFLKKNSELNLSAIRDEEWVQIKHINDSLELTKIWIINSWMSVCDIWTWWGFPLLPLAISYPDVTFLWIDSVRKKTVAVNEIIEKLELKNAHVDRTRIEEYNEKKFDVITARAVAYSDKLLKRSYPLLKKGWYFLFMKQKIPEERDLLLQLIKKYHLTLEQEHEYKLYPSDIERVIYVLRKN